jgi:hypothetical protein
MPLDAIVSNNSGSSEPSTKFAYEWWIDTSNNLLKLRNSANNAWITLPLSITADNATSGALTVNGNLTTTGTIDINGQELILDADADTSITADTDDQIDFKIGNVDVATLTNSNLVLKGTTPTLTIGDAGEEDTKIVFDGNAQDYYIGLDDSADDLIIGKGSTVGTTPAIIIDENLQVGIGATPHTTMVVNGGTFADISLQSSNSGTGASQGSLLSIDASNNLYLYNFENTPTIFGTNNAERMRIDSSGNLLVGKTSNTQASAGFQIDGSNLHNVTSTNSGTGSSTYMVHDGSGLNFYVNFTGEVNYKVALTNLSDQRLKENIVNLDKGLNDILKIKPRRFDWIEGEGEKNQMGFIAQEVEEAGLEELVRPFKGGSLDDAKGVNQTGLIAILVKAIQEQQTQIEALQSEINTLKGGD